ncbi:hypothetical protein [Pseudoduganella sp. R-43]|uniref:LysM peptidoglycan-binding domain-containing protein n=1 Tax=Pseudoduganella sp. R-43 TaxID=3404063 RepID=UPI003CF2DC2C
MQVTIDDAGKRTVKYLGSTAGPVEQNVRATSMQRLDRWGNVLEVSDPRNPDWFIRYSYNDNNQMVKQEAVDSALGEVRYLGETYFDEAGREVGQRDGRLNLQRKVYDADGQLGEEHHADGGLIEYKYSMFGDRTDMFTFTSADRSVHTQYAYDHLAHLSKVSNFAETWHTYEDSNGSLWAGQLNAEGEVAESYAYDELGRRTVTTDGMNGKRVVRYDHAGNILAEVDQVGVTTSYAYDAFGHKTAMVMMDDGGPRIQYWEYDPLTGRLASHTNGGNVRTTYTYTGLGQLATQTSPERGTLPGQNLKYTYDGDRLMRIDDLTNNKVTSYAYDLAGNHLRERTEAGGRVVQNNSIEYDQLGRMVHVGDGRFDLQITYDAAGNRETVRTTYTNDSGQENERWVMNKFDAMNRQTLVDGIVTFELLPGNTRQIAQFGQGSHEITYDWAGNRTSDKYHASNAVVTERFEYDGAGRLQQTFRDENLIDLRYYDGAGRVVRSGVDADATWGWLMDEWKLAKEYRITEYDAAGRMTRQKMRDLGNNALDDIFFKMVTGYVIDGTHIGYSKAGNLRGYIVVPPNGGPVTQFTTDYLWFDTAKESLASARNADGISYTTTQYDSNGFAVKVIEKPDDAVEKSRTFINDVNGQMLIRNDGGLDTYSLIVNGQLLGRSKVNDYDASFVNTYQPATASGLSAPPSAYVVRGSGETPSSIAQALWGDSKLWYLIADANGMAGDEQLAVGKTLRIPARVNTVRNDYQTFKPYDAADAVGNTTPAMPIPAAPAGSKGCGVVGQIVAVVVIVVATIYGQEWAAKLAAEAAWTGAAATAASMAGAAAGAMVGSAITQGASVAMGYQSKFSWKQVAVSGIGAAITAGMSGVGEGIAGAAMRGALSNAMTQGVSIVLGLQNGFKWRGVVAAAVGSAVGKAMGDGLNLNDKVAVAQMDWGERLFKASLVGFAAGTATAAMRGGKISVAQVATDAFGNALGSSMVQSMQESANQRAKLAWMDKRVDEVMADVQANGERFVSLGPVGSSKSASTSITISGTPWTDSGRTLTDGTLISKSTNPDDNRLLVLTSPNQIPSIEGWHSPDWTDTSLRRI